MHDNLISKKTNKIDSQHENQESWKNISVDLFGSKKDNPKSQANTLVRSDGHDKAPSEIPNKSEQTALEEQLKKNYNVSFSKDGETCDVYIKKFEFVRATARFPTLQEMQVIKSAIERFGLSDPNCSELKFVFLQDNQSLPGLGQPNAIYRHNSVTLPVKWNFSTTGNRSYLWFQKDTTGSYRQDNEDTFKHASAEGSILHELGHWIDERRDPTAWKFNYRAEDLSKQFGFLEVAQNRSDNKGVNIHCLVKGKDNDVYMLANDGWLRYDLQNDTIQLTINGVKRQFNLIDQPAEKTIFDFYQMSQRAAMPPGTIYWINPSEASADAKTCLYIGDKSRARMLQRSESAYRAAVQADQADIDFVRGKGIWMRAFNGSIVKRTTENLRALKEAEDKILQ